MSDYCNVTYRLSKDTIDKVASLSRFFGCSKTSVIDRCVRSAYSDTIDNKELVDLIDKLEDIKKQIDDISNLNS